MRTEQIKFVTVAWRDMVDYVLIRAGGKYYLRGSVHGSLDAELALGAAIEKICGVVDKHLIARGKAYVDFEEQHVFFLDPVPQEHRDAVRKIAEESGLTVGFAP